MNLRNRYKEQNAEVGTGSLNDILFILLLFFLIVSTLANPNVIKLALPNASGKDESKQTVVVSIDANNVFYIGTNAVPIDSLKAAVAPFLIEQQDPTIVINADKAVAWENVVKVMNVAKALKAKVVAATSPVATEGATTPAEPALAP
jgi:biopolymer transport protein ExbD